MTETSLVLRDAAKTAVAAPSIFDTQPWQWQVIGSADRRRVVTRSVWRLACFTDSIKGPLTGVTRP
jgi:hypothetical protein